MENFRDFLKENIVQKTKRTMFIGNITYVLPFKANGYWVEDAKGSNVCEAYNESVAKKIAEILNHI